MEKQLERGKNHGEGLRGCSLLPINKGKGIRQRSESFMHARLDQRADFFLENDRMKRKRNLKVEEREGYKEPRAYRT